MTITTKTYDDAVYKLVPIKILDDLVQATEYHFEHPSMKAYNAAISDSTDLPGVVTHSGEPIVEDLTDTQILSIGSKHFKKNHSTNPSTLGAYCDSVRAVISNYTYPALAEVEQLRQRVKELELYCQDCNGLVSRAGIREMGYLDQLKELEARLAAQPKPLHSCDKALVEWTRRACQVAVEDAINDEDDPLAAIELLDLSAGIQGPTPEAVVEATPRDKDSLMVTFTAGAKAHNEALIKAALEAAIEVVRKRIGGPPCVDIVLNIRSLSHAAIIQAAKEAK